MVIRAQERVGTGQNDEFTAFSGTVYFGLGGNDSIRIFPWSDGMAAIGGRGADVYFSAANSVLTVMDMGSSNGDTVVAPRFDFASPTRHVAVIDDRHLLLGDSEDRINIIIVDWQSPQNRIEYVQTATALLGHEDLQAEVQAAQPRHLRWEELSAYGIRPLATVEINEALAFYARRALELDGVIAPVLSEPPADATQPLFSREFYLKNNPDVKDAGIDPFRHYEDYGWKEGRDPFHCFSTSYYLSTNEDVRAAGINPLEHFVFFGGKEMRNPSTHFDAARYYADYPDVQAAGMNPLLHFLVHGIQEGRHSYDTGGQASPCDPAPLNPNPLPVQPPDSKDPATQPPPVVPPPVVPPPPEPATLLFTLGPDNLAGTAGSDLGLAPGNTLESTLQTMDKADFGDGYDVLIATPTPAEGGLTPTLTSLEEIRLEPVYFASQMNFSATTGLQRIVVENAQGSMLLHNISGALTGGIQVQDPLTKNHGVAFNFLPGTAKASLTLRATSGDTAQFGSVSVNEGDGAIGELDLHTAGSSLITVGGLIGGRLLNIDVKNAPLSILNDTVHDEVNLVGTGNFTAHGELLGASKIFAALSTGNFTAKVDDTLPLNIATGTGSDLIDFSDDQPGFNDQDFWDAGTGTDRAVLRYADVTNWDTSVPLTNLQDVEQLAIKDSVLPGAIHLDIFGAAGIREFFLSDIIGDPDTPATIIIPEGSNIHIDGNILGDTEIIGDGQSVTLTLNDVTSTGIIDIVGFPDVAIVSSKGVNIFNGRVAASEGIEAPLSTLTISGAASLVFNERVYAATIDASALTGNLRISQDEGAGGALGTAIIGGTGDDRLVGTGSPFDVGGDDTITGGLGADVLMGSPYRDSHFSQGDRLSGGPGDDVFLFMSDNDDDLRAISSGVERITHIQDFVAGQDKLSLVNTFSPIDETFVLEATQFVASAADLAAVYAAVTPIGPSVAGAYHGAMILVADGAAAGTYLFVNDESAEASAASDMLINLTGIAGNFSAGDVVFNDPFQP